MLIILSPSKTLDFSPQTQIKSPTEPLFLDRAETLVKKLRTLSSGKLAKLMGVSDKLADENHRRFQVWRPEHNAENSKPAVLAYRGDVYDGLGAGGWKSAEFKYAALRLRILSGLYGVLRPSDSIQPYRLEMGTPLPVARKKDLYAFWGDAITDALHEALAAAKTTTLINLASKEYFSAVQPSRLEAEIITPAFKEERGGKFKFLSFFGKKARGLLASYIARQRLTEPEQLKNFDVEGYRFNEKISGEHDWVFTRKS